MNLLLDTHALIWFAEGSAELSSRALEVLKDPEHVVYFSVASVWEMAIKTGLGKLAMSRPLEPDFRVQAQRHGLELLPIAYAHAAAVAALPLHHRDPFDRLLVAQAIAERMPLLSHDDHLDAYPIDRLW